MSMHLGSLKKTSSDLHRIWITVDDCDDWYAIMRECRSWFGTNWRSRKKVKQKLTQSYRGVDVWFDVPDPAIASWITVKLGIPTYLDTDYIPWDLVNPPHWGLVNLTPGPDK